jgi:phage terminase Nu1 subunit (DNA packaging protein)
MKNIETVDFYEAVSKLYAEEENQLANGYYDPDDLALNMARQRYQLARFTKDIKEGFKYEKTNRCLSITYNLFIM